jgi:dTMP kinase
MTEGVFITFEGGEGAGKTTLIEGIFRHLTAKGLSVVRTREPGGTVLGEKIRSLLLHGSEMSPYTELALFLASRAQHVAEVILPALKAGKVVLCDRFHESSIAYQGIARGLGKEDVEHMTVFLSQGLLPDVTFYLDLDPSVGFHRIEKSRNHDRIEQEGLPFHLKIRNAYLELVKENPRICLLDATLPKEKVYAKALEKMHACLPTF